MNCDLNLKMHNNLYDASSRLDSVLLNIHRYKGLNFLRNSSYMYIVEIFQTFGVQVNYGPQQGGREGGPGTKKDQEGRERGSWKRRK